MSLVGYFFAVIAFQCDGLFTDHPEPCHDGFIIGNAFRIEAFYDVGYLIWYFNHPFFGYHVITDDIQFGVGRNQCNFVYFVVGKKLVRYFYNGFAAQFSTFQIGAKGNLILNFVQPENGNDVKKILCR
jgi:hypothetical protein